MKVEQNSSCRLNSSCSVLNRAAHVIPNGLRSRGRVGATGDAGADSHWDLGCAKQWDLEDPEKQAGGRRETVGVEHLTGDGGQ